MSKPVLDFYPDYGAESPFWNERGEIVDTDLLPLPAELRARIDAWAEPAAHEYEDPAVVAEGRAIFDAAKAALKDRYQLVTTWFEEGE